jgi:hypothetical protein
VRAPSGGEGAPFAAFFEEFAAHRPRGNFNSPAASVGDHLRSRSIPPMREARAIEHQSISTEGSNPTLDREIAIARARLVRSPNSVTACYQLGKLLLRRGTNENLDEAMGQLTRAVALEPNHPGAHLAAAELAAKRGDFEAAADHLQRARRLGYRIDERLEKMVSEKRKA